MKYILILLTTISIFSCTEEVKIEKLDNTQEEITEEIIIDEKELIKNDGDTYIEYYPNGVSIKFKGPQDEEKERHGKWLYFSPEGKELSMTMYSHGKRHGHSIVHYPNGAIYYVGEYNMGEKIGVWKEYDKNGAVSVVNDYGGKQ